MKNLKILCVAVLGLASSAKAQQFSVTNLVTSNSAANPAVIVDPGASNSWGVSYSPTSPLWVSAEGPGLANVYTITTSNSVTKNSLIVTIPGAGSVTGQVWNGNSSAFHADNFLFVSEDGTISGWRSALGSTAETFVSGNTANVYTGATESTSGTNSYLYAANFRNNSIDYLVGTVTTPSLTGSFTDPALPAGYAPYNIQLLGGNLFVSYAVQNSTSSAAVKAPGNGLVDVYDTEGDFLSRVATGGSLNAPWGLAIAPPSFGAYAGDLLVGNFGDGRINAYNLGSDSFVGQLPGTDGSPLAIPGLWALTPGNGASAGSTQDIYFTAGPQNQANGLVGVITPVPEPSTLVLLAAGVAGLLGCLWRRNGFRTIQKP